jgi:hypothetical protein
MDCILANHAKKRCIQRKIHSTGFGTSWIIPHESTSTDVEDDSLLHVLYPVPERSFRVLRVIDNETTEPVPVVTAYFDDEVNDR